MSFQFCCPQGHVLQGELSQVGQLFQCPMCGSSFLIPPPDNGSWQMGGPVAAGVTSRERGLANAPGPSFPDQGPMPGMMPPQTMLLMPGSPMAPGPPAGSYPLPAPQPFAFQCGSSRSAVRWPAGRTGGCRAEPRRNLPDRRRKTKRASRDSNLVSIRTPRLRCPSICPAAASRRRKHRPPLRRRPHCCPHRRFRRHRSPAGTLRQGGLRGTVDANGTVCSITSGQDFLQSVPAVTAETALPQALRRSCTFVALRATWLRPRATCSVRTAAAPLARNVRASLRRQRGVPSPQGKAFSRRSRADRPGSPGLSGGISSHRRTGCMVFAMSR